MRSAKAIAHNPRQIDQQTGGNFKGVPPLQVIAMDAPSNTELGLKAENISESGEQNSLIAAIKA